VQQELIVSLNNTPPDVQIAQPKDGDLYPLNGLTLFDLQAEVQDAEHTTEALTYRWQTFLHHNTHYHAEPVVESPTTELLIDPLGCGDETYWYRIRLEVTDAHGLTTTDEVEIFPLCTDAFFEMANFTAFAESEAVRLDWQTRFEEEVQVFEIQRTTDFHFRTIATVEAGQQTYSFLDEKPERGTYHYRLKAIRTDGTYEYSDEVVVIYPTPPDFEVFPNPANEILYLRVKNVQTNSIQLELFNTYGGLMRQLQWEATPGEDWQARLQTQDLGWGTYFYRLTDGERSQEGKLVIVQR